MSAKSHSPIQTIPLELHKLIVASKRPKAPGLSGRWRDAGEAVRARVDAGAGGHACSSVRDRAWSSDAGELGDGWARRRQAGALHCGRSGGAARPYVEFCDDERVETLIGCHETAFLTFAGVPVEVLYDNMKTVVIERNTYGLGAHRFHAGFLDYARRAGIHAATLSAVSRADERQSRTLHRLSEAQLLGAVCRVDATVRSETRRTTAANAAVAQWLREVANTNPQND